MPVSQPPSRARARENPIGLVRLTRLALLSLLVALLAPSVSAMPRYTITVADAGERLQVTTCFPEPGRYRLIAHHERAPALIERLNGATLHRDGIRSRAGRRCLGYTVHLDRLAQTAGNNPVRIRDGSRLFDPNLWLWRPAKGQGALELTFQLPDGLSVSAPWPLRDAGPGYRRYRTTRRSPELSCRMAVGSFQVDTLRFPGGQFRVAVLDGDPTPDREALLRWIRSGGEALTTVFDRLPVEDVQILVIPVGPSDEEVPWAQVMRGGGDAVHLYVDQTRAPAELIPEWTLPHELAHLIHPRLTFKDAWLYEGLASYYQNVLRARSGLISPRNAWARLEAGFERGRRDTSPDRTLAEAAQRLYADNLFMRVYWSGAALALKADVALRRRGTDLSLDEVLRRFAACCLPAERVWTGAEFMQQLDALSNTALFTELYRAHVPMRHFPEVAAVYRELGLEVEPGTRIGYTDDAPLAAIRRAIMEPPDRDGTP